MSADYGQRVEKVSEEMVRLFGGNTEDIRYFVAPGRVNLIGEHIDYSGGYVFPAALSLDTIVGIRPRSDRKVRMAATDLKDLIAEFDLDNIDEARTLKWGNYQAGVALELINAGYKVIGCDMVFDGTIPFGSGLSSSASIELATAIAMATLGKEFYNSDKEIDLIELAQIGQRAENNFAGVSSGIMDQFASAMGKKDHAILLNCETLEYSYAPLVLKEHTIVIANTKKKRALGESKYNERRRETEEGFAILSEFLPGKASLCAITVDEFEQYKDKIEDEVIRKRVEHSIYENERVLKAVTLLKNNDIDAFGKLLVEANDSIRYLYEATGFELDTMVDEALKVEGTVGARMTGAGFGGCTVNIVKNESVDSFIDQVAKNYKAKTGLTPEFYISAIGDGARELQL